MENKEKDEDGTMIDVLKVACEELYPKFKEAGTSSCAKFAYGFLFEKLVPKTSARRKFRR